MIVAGQIVGAIAQGIGESLMEEIVYDESGQMLNASLLDYLLPTSLDSMPVQLAYRFRRGLEHILALPTASAPSRP